MARYATSTTSPHAPEAVFDYLADFSNVTEWDPNTRTSTRQDDGELGSGSSFAVVTDFGSTIKLTYEIVEYDRPGRVVLFAQGKGFSSRDTITVSPDGTGSRVTYEAVVAMEGLGRLIDPIISVVFRIIGGKAADGLRRELNRPSLDSANG